MPQITEKSKFSLDAKTPEVQPCDLDIDDIAYLTCRGGWPWATLISKEVALDQAFDYVDSVIKRDIQRVDKVKRSPERASRHIGVVP